MNLTNFFQSKKFQLATWIAAGFILLLLVFKLGVFVGYKKAFFIGRWSENYHRNFAGPRGGFFRNFLSDKRDFIGAHGVFGSVLSVDGTRIVVRGRDNVEKIILVTDKTVITRLRETVGAYDIKPDDNIVIIGEPNDAGEIQAKFVRIMPAFQK